MLEIKNLHVYYGNIHALKGIDLYVDEGEIVTLIGSNGAGKSTTLAAITGTLRPGAGAITFEGVNITSKSSSAIVKAGISLSPEGREVFPALTVEENLRLGAYTRTNKQEIKETFESVYDLFPRLLERKNQAAGTLSGGEQQMLSIGRAMMSKPELLLLDEPSLGLAPNLVMLIFRLIATINKQGVTVLLVEQNANMALSISKRAYVLETGKVVLSGDSSALLKDENVKKAYLGSK